MCENTNDWRYHLVRVCKQVHIATDLTITSCGKFEFIKFTVQTLNAQLSEVYRSPEFNLHIEEDTDECSRHHQLTHQDTIHLANEAWQTSTTYTNKL